MGLPSPFPPSPAPPPGSHNALSSLAPHPEGLDLEYMLHPGPSFLLLPPPLISHPGAPGVTPKGGRGGNQGTGKWPGRVSGKVPSLFHPPCTHSTTPYHPLGCPLALGGLTNSSLGSYPAV